MQIKKILKWMPCILAFAVCCTDDSSGPTNPPVINPETFKGSRLIVTEIMYNNGTDSLDFIEIKNNCDSAIKLDGMTFSQGISFTFPANSTLARGAYTVLTNSLDLFKQHYPSVTPNGVFTGSISNSGEIIELISLPDSTKEFAVEFGCTGFWPALADGLGYSLITKDEKDPGDQNDFNDWNVSVVRDGTPGKAETPVSVNSVYVNEVVISGKTDRIDKVELYNPSKTTAADVSNWYLSDDRKNPKKYCIPANTVVQPNGYLVLDASAFKDVVLFTTGGGDAYIFSAAGGNLTGFSNGLDYEDADIGSSIGLTFTSDSAYRVCHLESATPNAVNSKPAAGEVVINEIMYHPSGTVPEYIEIKNVSEDSVNLFTANDYWKIEGVSFTFTAPVTLKKDGILLLVDSVTNTESFRVAKNIDASVTILNFNGKLSNKSEIISIKKPGNDHTDAYGVTEAAFRTVDIVEYKDNDPWPDGADGDGYSLTRRDSKLWGNDPASWRASDAVGGTPGK